MPKRGTVGDTDWISKTITEKTKFAFPIFDSEFSLSKIFDSENSLSKIGNANFVFSVIVLEIQSVSPTVPLLGNVSGLILSFLGHYKAHYRALSGNCSGLVMAL